MLEKLWTALTQPFRRTPQPLPRFTVVMTAQCRDQLTEQLRESVQKGYEGIVYFVGLTTGVTTLALSAMSPKVSATPGSVDVSAPELGKISRFASLSGLQVVGQLHTHPRGAHHSDGDLCGDENTASGLLFDSSAQLRCSAAVVTRCSHLNVGPRRIPRGRTTDHVI